VGTLPVWKKLQHQTPEWAVDSAIYYLTICTLPRQLNQLCWPHIGRKILDSVAYRETLGHWWTHVCLLMPDHLHMLITPAESPGLASPIVAWKRYTRHTYSVRWQRDFFDHRLRSDESFAEKAEYILQNPVRAGLVERAEDWPYRLQNMW
jgi:REP element-mobilizing transposase RayT